MLCLVAQSCPTLCDPMDCSPPGSSVHGILQARILGIFPTQVSCIAGGLFIVWATGEAIPESPGSHHINPIPTYCLRFHSQRLDIFWFGRVLIELLLLNHLVMSDSFYDSKKPTRVLYPQDFSVKNIEVGCQFLPQPAGMCPPTNSHVEAWHPMPQNVIVFGDRAISTVIKLKWGH